jgi:hypothetical protein
LPGLERPQVKGILQSLVGRREETTRIRAKPGFPSPTYLESGRWIGVDSTPERTAHTPIDSTAADSLALHLLGYHIQKHWLHFLH